MELPINRMPSPSVVFHRVWASSWSFVRQAGTLIFATSVLIWAAGSFPGDNQQRYQLMTEIESLESAESPDEAKLSELK